MNSKAALCKALLDGRVLNIKNGFDLLGITNIPREIGRSVERAFGVQVSRTPKEGQSRYHQKCVWVDYRLNNTEYNKEGIKKMREYISKHYTIPDKHHAVKKQLSTHISPTLF